MEDLIKNRERHNYAQYKDEVDDYRQDHFQLHLDQAMGDWNLGGVVYSTLGAGFYEQFKQDEDLSAYGFDPYVVQVFDTTGALMGSDTVGSTNLVRRRWLDNTFVGVVLDHWKAIGRIEPSVWHVGVPICRRPFWPGGLDGCGIQRDTGCRVLQLRG